jgi:hypothetical protein
VLEAEHRSAQQQARGRLQLGLAEAEMELHPMGQSRGCNCCPSPLINYQPKGRLTFLALPELMVSLWCHHAYCRYSYSQ